MTYYHVEIKITKSKDPYYELDRTDLSEIKGRVIIPFLKKKQVSFSSHLLAASDIASIVIKESDKVAREYVDDFLEKNEEVLASPSPHFLLNGSSDFIDITDRVFEECRAELMNPLKRALHWIKQIFKK